MRLFCILALLASSALFAQDTISVDASEPLYVCSPKHPESAGPCAKPPRPIYTPDPTYSEHARQKHIQGTVVLDLTVGADGMAKDIKVQRPLGDGLDEMAIEAVKQWKFTPATYQDQPVAVRINIEVNFRMYDSPPNGSPGARQPNWKDLTNGQYNNTSIGISASFPTDWKLVSEQTGSLTQSFVAVIGKPPSPVAVVLTREHLEATPEVYAKVVQQFLEKRDNYRRTAESNVTRDGITGKRWNITWSIRGVEYRGIIEFFTADDQHFRIFAMVPDDNYTRFASDFENVFTTIKFPQMHVSEKDLIPSTK